MFNIERKVGQKKPMLLLFLLSSPPCSATTILFLRILLHPTRLHTSTHIDRLLQTTQSVLLVNVPVTLLLHPVLENHGDGKHKHGIKTDDTESSSENAVEILVGKGRERADAASLLGGDEGVATSDVLDEGWSCRVDVAAAVELLLKQTLDNRCLPSPEIAEVLASLQGLDPDSKT